MKRPPTIWITQTLLLIFASIWLLSLAFNLMLLAIKGTQQSFARVAIGVSILLAMIVLLLTAVWGLARRRLYGKWLGVLSLVVLWGTIIYTQIRPSAGPIKRFEYNSAAELVGASITYILVSVGFLVLIINLAFAKKVDAFFDRGKVVASDQTA
jgi:hypothetical protein